MNIIDIVKKEWVDMDFYPIISFLAVFMGIIWSFYYIAILPLPSMLNQAASLSEFFSVHRDLITNLKIEVIIWSIVMSGFFVILFNYMHYRVLSVIKRMPVNKEVINKFSHYSKYSYGVVLLSSLTFFGLMLNIAFFSLLTILWLIIQSFIFFKLCNKTERTSVVTSVEWLAGLFMLSGFAALIYQVAWQRILFEVFGVDIVSVTVIVSVFMFGLGIGSLVGGWLSRVFKNKLVALFMTLEILIGVFGVFSVPIIKFVNNFAGTTDVLQLSIYVYIILAIPTLLMGATLPVLVTYLHTYYKNVGRSIGVLYAFNTLGSAIAAFITVSVLFVISGLSMAIYVAAAANFITALLIYFFAKNIGNKFSFKEIKEKTKAIAQPSLPFFAALLIAMTTGYIALSQEIIWFRAFNLVTGGQAPVFGYILTAFLIGIAFGALKAKKICEENQNIYSYIVKALFISTTIYILMLPVMAWGVDHFGFIPIVLGYIAIGFTSFYMGSIFPLLTHISIAENTKHIGSRLSCMYFANIIGATAGPIITGFILFDNWGLVQNIYFVAFLSTGLLILFALANIKKLDIKPKQIFVSIVIAGSIIVLSPFLYSGFMEKMNFYAHHIEKENRPFKYLIENRSGVISVQENKGKGDIIYGGGVYDGMFSIDPVMNYNLITRAYSMAILHKNPKTVLEIGFGGGSWGKAISLYEGLEEMTIVEINKGYYDIIDNYPKIASIKKNSKVTLVVDDGRRWLKNNPNRKFDFIVMNSSYHWRGNSSNLFSVEFLEMAKQHLNPNGSILYNTTRSFDIVYTAAQVFKYVTKVNDFVAASDSPFDMIDIEKRQNLLKFIYDDGSLVFDPKQPDRAKVLKYMIDTPLLPWHEMIKKQGNLWVITDDNMATEYKTLAHVYQPKYNIFKIWNRLKDADKKLE